MQRDLIYRTAVVYQCPQEIALANSTCLEGAFAVACGKQPKDENPMTFFKLVCCAIAGLVVAGCMTTTTEAPDQRYAGVERQTATALGERFYFFERPDESRILATLRDKSIGSVIVYTGSIEDSLRRGLQSHFFAKGLACEIGSGTLIEEGSYEFPYTCKGSVLPKRYCVTEAECRAFEAEGSAVDRSFVGVPPQSFALEYWRVEVFDKASLSLSLLRFKKRQGWVQVTEADFEKMMRKFASTKVGVCEWIALKKLSNEERVYEYTCQT